MSSPLEDSDPMGHPTWTNRQVRRPSVDREGHECGIGDTGMSEIVDTKDYFQIKLQSWPYEPEEISINRDPSAVNGIIVVGKKLDKETKQPIIESVFSQQFVLPVDVNYDHLKKSYASSGVVVIEAQKTGGK